MLFSSHIFLFYFLPLALGIYYAFFWATNRIKNLILALLGYVFYGWANPQFVFIMLTTTLIDWFVSLVIANDTLRFWEYWQRPVVPLPSGERSKVQKRALLISILSNLTILGFFKYFNFSVDSFNAFMAATGLTHHAIGTFYRVILPLGISFYTLQALSYTIDVYRGDAKAMRNFIDFACFVSMFPHLVAGPILKFSFLADQIENRKLTVDKFARGVAFFSLGLAAKVLLANPCGKVADTTFNAGSVTPVDAWFGAISYAFQIFFDFSGYSNMAIGLGLMLGFVFAKNFDAPYRAQSITDFWRRWHISLSTWLREYLYIPLGGNRQGQTRTYMNLMITMLIGGLWHGASWNFVIWGGLHGLMLSFERMHGKSAWYMAMPGPIRTFLTFLSVILAWVFFRSATLPRAAAYLISMFGLTRITPEAQLLSGIIYQPYYLLIFVVAATVVWIGPRSWAWTQQLTWPKAAACTAALWAAIVVLTTQAYNPFIYFNF